MFTGQTKPRFKPGSLKAIGRLKWGFYLNMFLRLTDNNGFSFSITPLDYLRHWEEAPRLMAILETIQERYRQKSGEAADAITNKRGQRPRKGVSKYRGKR